MRALSDATWQDKGRASVSFATARASDQGYRPALPAGAAEEMLVVCGSAPSAGRAGPQSSEEPQHRLDWLVGQLLPMSGSCWVGEQRAGPGYPRPQPGQTARDPAKLSVHHGVYQSNSALEGSNWPQEHM